MDQKTGSSYHRLHGVPKRILFTIGNETSTTTRHRDVNTPLHIGVAESTQSADAEHVVTTAVVATMVFPVKGIVEDIAVGSSTGAVDLHVVNAVSVQAQDQ